MFFSRCRWLRYPQPKILRSDRRSPGVLLCRVKREERDCINVQVLVSECTFLVETAAGNDLADSPRDCAMRLWPRAIGFLQRSLEETLV